MKQPYLKSRYVCVNSNCKSAFKALSRLKDAKVMEIWGVTNDAFDGYYDCFYACRQCGEPLFVKPHDQAIHRMSIIKQQQFAFKRMNIKRRNANAKKQKNAHKKILPREENPA